MNSLTMIIMKMKLILCFTVSVMSIILSGCNTSKKSDANEVASVNQSVAETTVVIQEVLPSALETPFADTTLAPSEVLPPAYEIPCADTTLAHGRDLTFNVKGVTFKMKPVEGGSFLMGAQDQNPEGANYIDAGWVLSCCWPVHKVVVSSFYMGETEVTQALWKAVMGKTVQQHRDEANASYYMRGVGDDYPMYYVNWEDCQEFIVRLNQLTGKDFRLPTEAEWEYAARGGKKSHGYYFAGNNEIDSVACYFNSDILFGYIEAQIEAEMDESERISTSPVKSLQPNELGLYAMSGNVNEWCSDWLDGISFGGPSVYYGKSPLNNPQGPDTGEYHIIRGGGFFDNDDYCAVFSRGYQDTDRRASDTGLRLVLPQK